jgi:hypothetical protein
MRVDRLQAARFEQKYMVDEETALRVREFVRSYLDVDENGVGKPDYSYPVHSLYLDSNDLKLYWRTINGTKNRFKLRLRFYDNNPESPIFFEIKRRMNNCILKQRAAVNRAAVVSLLAGHLPEESHLACNAPKHLTALQNFCRLMSELQASPKAHIGYLREAYVPPGRQLGPADPGPDGQGGAATDRSSLHRDDAPGDGLEPRYHPRIEVHQSFSQLVRRTRPHLWTPPMRRRQIRRRRRFVWGRKRPTPSQTPDAGNGACGLGPSEKKLPEKAAPKKLPRRHVGKYHGRKENQ